MYYFKYLCKFNDNLEYFKFKSYNCEFLLKYYKNKNTREFINIIKKIMKDSDDLKYSRFQTSNYYGGYSISPEMLPLYYFQIVFKEILNRKLSDKDKNNIIYLKYKFYNKVYLPEELILYSLEYKVNIFHDLMYKLYYNNNEFINKEIYNFLLIYSHLLKDLIIIKDVRIKKLISDFYVNRNIYLKKIIEHIFRNSYEDEYKKVSYSLSGYLNKLVTVYNIEKLKKTKNIQYLELIIVLLDLSIYEEDYYSEIDYYNSEDDKENKFCEIISNQLEKLSTYLKIFSEHEVRDISFLNYYSIYKANCFKGLIEYESLLNKIEEGFNSRTGYIHNCDSDIAKYNYLTKTPISDIYDSYRSYYYLYYDHCWPDKLPGFIYEEKKDEEEKDDEQELNSEDILYSNYNNNNYYYDNNNDCYDDDYDFIREYFDWDEDSLNDYFEDIVEKYE